VRDLSKVMSGLILASSFASAALVIPIARLLVANDSSIVSLFDQMSVRSNEDTIVLYRKGPTLLRSVEQVFDLADPNHYRQP